MLDSGVWELGGHTETHANLDKIDGEAKQKEIVESKSRLEKKFGVRVSSFAYPFGIFTEEDINYVKNAGYDTAVSTVEGIDESVSTSRFALKRIKISGKDGSLAFLLRIRTGRRG
jgi:peptidoglycan/xylan/chitin deacetylase (PgdA/CDA1 family)